MRKDLNNMFTEEEWFTIYMALAAMKFGNENGDFPRATEMIDVTLKKVHEFIDDTDPAIGLVDLLLMFS